MHIRRALAWLTVLLLVTSGCGDDSDDGEDPDRDAGGEPEEVTGGPGVDDDEIRVAVLNDFSSDSASFIGTPAAVGSEVYFEALNEEGGICGRTVKVESRDTEYDTQKAFQEYRAVKDDVAFVTQLLGTESVFALSEEIAADNMTTLAGTLTSAVIPLPNIYIVQTPFALEAVNGLAWAAEEHAPDDGPLQVGIIYADNAYGEEGLNAALHADEELDALEIVAESGYADDEQDFTAHVQEMESAGAELVYLHNLPTTTPLILGAAADRDYDPLWLGNSGSYGSFLVDAIGPLLEGFHVVNSSVSWGEDLPEMDRMLDAVETHAPDQEPDNWLVTGWVTAKVTHAALERACDMGDLSREGIAQAMDGLQVDLEGMAPDISYGSTPDERVPSQEVRINEIDLETTFPTPVTEYFASEAAGSWTLPEPQG